MQQRLLFHTSLAPRSKFPGTRSSPVRLGVTGVSGWCGEAVRRAP